MKCTVLGAKGYIGRHLVKYLKAQGCEVFSPDRIDNSIFKKKLGHVFYSIGLTSDFRTRPFDTVKAHVSILSEILEKSDFESFLYLSSTRVYVRSTITEENADLKVLTRDSSDLYNISKLMGESLCLSCFREGVRVARLSNVVGPNMDVNSLVGSLILDARKGLVQLRTNPESLKDYIYIDDVVYLLWRIAITGRLNIYNIASGNRVSHRQWLDYLYKFTDCEMAINENAPLESFPNINIENIKTEFGFNPIPISKYISKLNI